MENNQQTQREHKGLAYTIHDTRDPILYYCMLNA